MNPEIEEKAKEVFADVMLVDFDDINSATSPATVPAWTSFNHLTLMSAVEESFAIQLSMEEMNSIPNFGTLVQTIQEHLR